MRLRNELDLLECVQDKGPMLLDNPGICPGSSDASARNVLLV